MNDKLVPMTIRLESSVRSALATKAAREGQEDADYAAGVLARDLLPIIDELDPSTADRMRAELEVKARAIAVAQRITEHDGFDPNITLKVFQEIKSDTRLNELYLRAIGGRPGDERGNPIKARLNRSLGAAIKTAVGGAPEKVDGSPVKIQVPNEYIFSYTLLRVESGSGAPVESVR